MMQDHQGVRRLDFLPYHFLLTSVGEGGILRYQVLHRPDPLASMLAKPVNPSSEACWQSSSHEACTAAPQWFTCISALHSSTIYRGTCGRRTQAQVQL